MAKEAYAVEDDAVPGVAGRGWRPAVIKSRDPRSGEITAMSLEPGFYPSREEAVAIAAERIQPAGEVAEEESTPKPRSRKKE